MAQLIDFKSKTELIYDKILASILDGHIRPGERLNVDALVREYGVSKIPIRETLQKLEMQGLVIQVPHIGASVAPLSFREMKGLFLLREAIEGMAARIAATIITADELSRLDALNDEMASNLQRNQLREMSKLNLQFHTAIAQATQYETIKESVESNLRKVRLYRVGIQRVDANWHQVLDEHRDICKALQVADAAAAEASAQLHVRQQLQVELAAQIDHSLFVDTLVNLSTNDNIVPE